MAMPIRALTAARHMCERSDWTLTNLELQKMLYLAQMAYMGENEGSKLIRAMFEAWDYGPVIPELYREAKVFGKAPIKFLFGTDDVKPDETRIKMLNEAYDQLSKFTPGQLINATHSNVGAWARYYKPGIRGIEIPDAAILQEYHDRFAPND